MTNQPKLGKARIALLGWSAAYVILIALVTFAADLTNLDKQAVYLGRVIAVGFITVVLSILGAVMVITTAISNGPHNPSDPS
jgi:uncharacterized membrane protein